MKKEYTLKNQVCMYILQVSMKSDKTTLTPRNTQEAATALEVKTEGSIHLVRTCVSPMSHFPV